MSRAVRLIATAPRVFACCAALFTAGCSEDDAPPQPAYIIHIWPQPGSTIPTWTEVTLVFNRDPGPVQTTGVQVLRASPSGTTRVFEALGPPMQFTWGDGESLAVEYTVLYGHAPSVTLDSVSTGVDHSAPLEELRSNGIVMVFSEAVYAPDGHWASAFEITDADGGSWRPHITVVGSSVTLRETDTDKWADGHTYTITGTVASRRGDETDIAFFVTVGEGGAEQDG